MSIDRREDAGDFYTGGKVISTRPVATGGDVKHSDFAGLDVKTNTIPDLREAVRELGRRLGATVVTALAICVASAATVQTVPVNDLDFDANPSIVTNVVFDAPPDLSTNNTALVETIEATAPAPGNYANVSNKAMNAHSAADFQAFYDNDYCDSIDGIIADFRDVGQSLNSKQDALPYPTNAIPYAAISGKPNLATVATSGSYNDLSNKPTIPTVPTNVSAFNNDAGYLTSFTESDPVWESEKEDYATMWDLDDYATVWDLGDLEDRADALEAATNDLATAIGNALGEAKSYTDEQIGFVQDSLTPLTATLNSSIKSASAASTNYTDAATNALAQSSAAAFMPASFTETDPTISSWAKAAQKPTYTASEVGAATAADVYRLIAGTNVVLVVTNYNSQTHAPAMKLQHLDPESGQYVTYWDETRRHGTTLTNAMNYTDAAIRTRAPAAWSGTTSGMGQEAPAGVTWISTPETVIAGGFEYEKVVTSAGAVWILTSNGLSTGATTNSFFRVSASDGTELFSIEKTDSYLVGVSPDGITRSGNTVAVPVNVVGNAHPYIRATTNLVDAVWTKEDENGFSCPWATVSWSGTTGAYVATVTCSEPQAFFYFEYLVEGVAKVKNSAKTELTGGIYFNGQTYMPTLNGNKLEFVRQ